jgi:ketosteroid isomerase-like protein
LDARADIGRTIQSFYAALAKDDYVGFQRATTPDYYAFEIGKRYSGKELSDLIAKSHAEGRIINWAIGPLTMQVDCTVSTATWENNGSAGSAGKMQPRAWLESAGLKRQDNRWLIAFLHSTPKDPR